MKISGYGNNNNVQLNSKIKGAEAKNIDPSDTATLGGYKTDSIILASEKLKDLKAGDGCIDIPFYAFMGGVIGGTLSAIGAGVVGAVLNMCGVGPPMPVVGAVGGLVGVAVGAIGFGIMGAKDADKPQGMMWG